MNSYDKPSNHANKRILLFPAIVSLDDVITRRYMTPSLWRFQ